MGAREANTESLFNLALKSTVDIITSKNFLGIDFSLQGRLENNTIQCLREYI
jgi:hypothetical protein